MSHWGVRVPGMRGHLLSKTSYRVPAAGCGIGRRHRGATAVPLAASVLQVEVRAVAGAEGVDVLAR